MPNLSNYGNFFVNFECLLWRFVVIMSKKSVLILFIFGTVIRYYVLFMSVKLHLFGGFLCVFLFSYFSSTLHV